MNHDLIVITSKGQIGPAIDGILTIGAQGCTGLSWSGGSLNLMPGTGSIYVLTTGNITIEAPVISLGDESIKLNDREERNYANI